MITLSSGEASNTGHRNTGARLHARLYVRLHARKHTRLHARLYAMLYARLYAKLRRCILSFFNLFSPLKQRTLKTGALLCT